LNGGGGDLILEIIMKRRRGLVRGRRCDWAKCLLTLPKRPKRAEGVFEQRKKEFLSSERRGRERR